MTHQTWEELMERPIHRVVDLIDQRSQQIYNMELEEARGLLLRDDATSLTQLLGSFALTAREGEVIRMARSLDRPMRYFLAKQESGPLLVVADRIDEIQEFLVTQGYGDQFH
ncbi:MAG: asparagine synthetase B family protein, partial [Thermoanaerobaculia bacterium]